ncbi:MAG: hypothetical protein GX432_14405 [Candidatus Atribacteria bacterium]|nr:hypothetical protein [Candidatus Atribacteria bacterium]
MDEIATSHKTLLAMTEELDEIAMSHKTLLAKTGQEKIQISPSSPFVKRRDSFSLAPSWERPYYFFPLPWWERCK